MTAWCHEYSLPAESSERPERHWGMWMLSHHTVAQSQLSFWCPVYILCTLSSNTKERLLCCLQVEWPLSIVVSQQAMAQYQLIFRHLFELKYVEQQLNSVWQILQSTRRLYRSVVASESKFAKR